MQWSRLAAAGPTDDQGRWKAMDIGQFLVLTLAAPGTYLLLFLLLRLEGQLPQARPRTGGMIAQQVRGTSSALPGTISRPGAPDTGQDLTWMLPAAIAATASSPACSGRNGPVPSHHMKPARHSRQRRPGAGRHGLRPGS